MNVLYIGKYPPLEGGASSAAFWRITALKEAGISFRVVSIHSGDGEYLTAVPRDGGAKTPWHIPYSQLYAEQLVSKALDYLSCEHFDAVEGAYLFPFGFAAYTVSLLSGKPLLLRHAGSDIYRLAATDGLRTLTRSMALYATKIVTHQDYVPFWNGMDIPPDKLCLSARYVPNPSFFCPQGQKKSVAVFLGKLTEKWDGGQLPFFSRELRKHCFNGTIHIYSSSRRREEMRLFFGKEGYGVEVHPFVHPSDVPKILTEAEFALISKPPNGIPECSNTFLEALSCGCQALSEQPAGRAGNYSGYLQDQLRVYGEL